MGKLEELKITPAQLALDPCSASAVVVQRETGKVLVLVSYPGFPNLKCWKHTGHGNIVNAQTALQNSCNDYLCEIAYRLGTLNGMEYADNAALGSLQEYSNLFYLDRKPIHYGRIRHCNGDVHRNDSLWEKYT